MTELILPIKVNTQLSPKVTHLAGVIRES
jgi:hypothetical protein